MVPLAVDEGFAQRAATHTAVAAGRALAEAIVAPQHGGYADEFVDVATMESGWVARLGRVSVPAASAVAVGLDGVVGAMVRERGVRVLIDVEPLVDETLLPLLSRTAAFLASLGVGGRALCDLHARGFHGVHLQVQGGGAAELTGRTYGSEPRVIAMTLLDDRLHQVALDLAFDLARDAGLAAFR
jgi:hypothetical protein